jgi:ComF family protein
VLIDWCFPPQCIGCAALATTLCAGCALGLAELDPSHACSRCSEVLEDGAGLCRRCRRSPLPLDAIVAPWRFGGPLADAVRRLKFARRPALARDLAPLWADLVAAAAGREGVVVPVPLHWWRRMRRGYDHAWLLALHACRAAGLAPPVPALRRLRATPAQSKLDAGDRAANVRGAFAVREPRAIVDRAIVLVDDVVTTGATMTAAATALLDAGAARVTGVCLARATT